MQPFKLLVGLLKLFQLDRVVKLLSTVAYNFLEPLVIEWIFLIEHLRALSNPFFLLCLEHSQVSLGDLSGSFVFQCLHLLGEVLHFVSTFSYLGVDFDSL